MKWSKSKSIVTGIAVLAIATVAFAGPFKDNADRTFEWYLGGVEQMTLSNKTLSVDNLAGGAGEAIGTKTAARDMVDVDLIAVPNTQITNRAKIRDLAAIPTPKMGIERVNIGHETFLIPGETGPLGIPVYGSVDPLDRLRFAGSWFKSSDAGLGSGVRFNVSGSGDDFLEISFYGTAVNILHVSQPSMDLRVTVDGGAESGNIYPSGSFLILSNRGYATNEIVPIVTGLSEDYHTVKIRIVSGNLGLHGLELINDSTDLDYAAGDVISGADKHAIAAGSTSYNTGFDPESDAVGTKGGHVVVYSERNATTGVVEVKKRFNATDTSQLTLGSTNHANEHVIAEYYFRDFGSGRGDDFSTLTTTSDRAFTLDDGTTTLKGDGVAAVDFLGETGLAFNVGSVVTLTFVGTGLDIRLLATGSITNDIAIDGSSIGNIATGAGVPAYYSIVSGMPYGTHTVSFTHTAGSQILAGYKLYAPKKPELTAGEAALSSYYLMADFVANTTVGIDTISQGVIRKHITREVDYKTSTVSLQFGVTSYIGGYQLNSTDATAEIDLSFFGTGFDLRYGNNPTHGNSTEITIDGVLVSQANFTINGSGTGPAITAVEYGSGSFNPATGILNHTGTAEQGSGLAINGFTLGRHTIGYEPTTATQSVLSSFDLVTQIHVPDADQNLLRDDLIGSNSIKNELSYPNFVKGRQYFPDGIEIPPATQETYGLVKKYPRIKYKPSSNALTNGVTVPFDNEIDAANFTRGNWLNNAGVITVPKTGYYYIHLHFGRNGAFNVAYNIIMTINGVTSNDYYITGLASTDTQTSGSLAQYLIGGQNIQLNWSGANNSLDSNTAYMHIIGFDD